MTIPQSDLAYRFASGEPPDDIPNASSMKAISLSEPQGVAAIIVKKLYNSNTYSVIAIRSQSGEILFFNHYTNAKNRHRQSVFDGVCNYLNDAVLFGVDDFLYQVYSDERGGVKIDYDYGNGLAVDMRTNELAPVAVSGWE